MLDELLSRLLWDVKIVKFYPYSTCVQQRIVQIDCGWNIRESERAELDAYYHHLMNDMVNRAKDQGIKCEPDNKIAFEFIAHGHTMFLGFYDGQISLGFKADRR